MYKFVFGSFLVIVIVWIYTMQYRLVKCDAVYIDSLINHNILKTGDMVIFKAYNNFYSIYHGSYYGHVGMIYVDEQTKIPYLFEANGIERTALPHHSTTGIFLTPVASRVKKYKGRCFLKQLNKAIDPELIANFKEFIDYAVQNMSYDESFFRNALKKISGLQKCGDKTNCGEITFLSLIKLGLVPHEEYDNNEFHHLKTVCNITELSDGYYYHPIVEIVDPPY